MSFAKSLSCVRRLPAQRSSSGLTRAETIWVVLLVASCAFAILGSLQSDESGRNLREAQHELQYLAGQVRFALEVDPNHGSAWPAVMLSKGSPPSELAEAESLSHALGSELYLPTDPWGNAYVCERRSAGAWDIWCAGRSARTLQSDADLKRARENELLIELRLPPHLVKGD